MDKRWAGLYACFMYGTISTFITFFNKAVLSYYKFPYPMTLTLAQIIFGIAACAIMKQIGMVQYPDMSKEMFRRFLAPGILFAVQVITGLWALVTVNVPMFGVLRRFTTFIVWIFEWVFQNKRTPRDETLSLFVMLFGAIVAGADDMSFDPTGYILIGLNCILTAWYLVTLNMSGASGPKVDSIGQMFYSNIVSLPLVLVAALGSGELKNALSTPIWSSFGFEVSFIGSAGLAFFLNYFIYLCTNVNSALATSVTGQIKTIVTTVVGLFMFGDVTVTFWNTIGLLIGVAGSVWYSVVKYMQTLARQKADRQAASNV